MAREPAEEPLMAVEPRLGSLRSFKRLGRLLIAQNSCQLAEGSGHSSSKKQIRDFAGHFDREPADRFHDERRRIHDETEDPRRLVGFTAAPVQVDSLLIHRPIALCGRQRGHLQPLPHHLRHGHDRADDHVEQNRGPFVTVSLPLDRATRSECIPYQSGEAVSTPVKRNQDGS
jgi:hypothetical protein